MKKFILFLVVLLLIGGGIAAWIFLGSATDFTDQKKALYISTNASTKKAVLDSLKKNKIITNETAFEFLADKMDYWKNIKPGKYEIKKGSSLLSIVRMLRNGKQTPVDLVITKLRTKEDFAKLIGRKFETDSAQMLAFLNSNDSLKKFETEREVSMWNLLPDTYTYFWNSSPSMIYEKLYKKSKSFWTDERIIEAKTINLSPLEAYILASIIEEETTNNNEKDTIASVYLNRLKIDMPLQADPTLKFATREFALKKIAGDILNVESPFNTYRNKGLPPGPICTPSKITIDAVLNPAQTNYLYFVANRKLNGHLYSETFGEHVKKANQYREDDKKRQKMDSIKAIK
jgi:UPF0755 protein